MKTCKYTKLFLVIFILLLTLPVYADIIITKSEGNIEDVSVIEITDTEIFYKEKGIQKSIPYEKVEAILYDDGRYVSLPKKGQTITTDNDNVMEEMESSQVSDNSRKYKEHKDMVKGDGRPSSYEVKKAFKEAANATKEAFSKMFNSWKKDKKVEDDANFSTSQPVNEEDDTNSPTPQPANEDNW